MLEEGLRAGFELRQLQRSILIERKTLTQPRVIGTSSARKIADLDAEDQVGFRFLESTIAPLTMFQIRIGNYNPGASTLIHHELEPAA